MAPKKKPTDELKDQRIPIMMSEAELEAIDNWGFKNRIRSRGEAIRRLCQLGISFDETIGSELHKKAIQSFNLVTKGVSAFDREEFTNAELDAAIDSVMKALYDIGELQAEIAVSLKGALFNADLIKHLDETNILMTKLPEAKEYGASAKKRIRDIIARDIASKD